MCHNLFTQSFTDGYLSFSQSFAIPNNANILHTCFHLYAKVITGYTPKGGIPGWKSKNICIIMVMVVLVTKPCHNIYR